MKDGMIRLLGLWKHQDKHAQDFWSGTLGTAKIMVFPNGYKRDEKHPDLIVYIAPLEEKREAEKK